VLPTVARIAERDVAALLTASLSPIQDGRRARDGSHDRQRDADGQAGTVSGFVVVHGRHVSVVVCDVIVVVAEPTSARLCLYRRQRAPGRVRGVSCVNEEQNATSI